MSKTPNPSEEIQKILSESDLWDCGFSEVEIAESYSAKRLRWTTQYIHKAGWLKMLGLASIPPAVAVVFGLSTDSVFRGIAAGLILLVVEILIFYFAYAPKEMYEAVKG